MDADTWQRAKAVLADLIEVPPHERAAHLDQHCVDADLRRDIEELLRHYDDKFLASISIDELRDAHQHVDSASHASTIASARTATSGVTSRLTPGQLFGRYRIERLLGKGGMGEVYDAHEMDSGRRVALKVLNVALTSDADRARFRQEGRLAASVNHPNSVYIYGSDEIEGIPVIAMELVGSGTLKDLVRAKGRLEPTAAVDAVLQMIAGLEASADAGVLHRDVKPSNCFVDVDGTIKIGDFGLSISTLSRDATQLTLAGTVLGTPEFASPEQLRGDALDVRADIYSVGATLHYLLTGQLLFDEPDIVKVVAAVLERPPRSARELQRDVPAKLADVVRRSLAKRADERYRSYEALRRALLPFSSAKSTPARIGIRILAGFIDAAIVFLPSVRFLEWWTYDVGGLGLPTSHPSEAFMSMFAVLGPRYWLPFFYVAPVLSIVPLTYFSILEGVWGLTIGKWLCGLRLVRVPGLRLGVLRAAARAMVVLSVLLAAPRVGSLFLMAPLSHLVAALVVRHAPPAVLAPTVAALPRVDPSISETMRAMATLPTEVVPVAGLILMAFALFISARRRNGFLALQDLATGTRVIGEPADRHRFAAPAAAPSKDFSHGSIGPYLLGTPLLALPDGELLLAFDQRLRRDVWIHRQRVGSAPIPPTRRDLSRPGRPRWLNGQRTDQDAWDAYEALNGVPIATAAERRHSWQTVRTWLADLAAEVPTLIDKSAHVPLSVNRVWITSDQHAKYLDFDLIAGGSVRTFPADMTGAQMFLTAVVNATLDGKSPRPVHAEMFLRSLDARRINDPGALAAEARAAADGPATLSRRRRFVHVCGALVATLSLSNVATHVFLARIRPDFSRLKLAMSELARLETGRLRSYGDTSKKAEAWRTYIAGRFRSTIENRQAWSSLQGRAALSALGGISDPLGNQQERAERILSSHPDVTAADLNLALRALGTNFALNVIESPIPGFEFSFVLKPPDGIMFLMGMFAVGVVGVVSAVMFRGGLALRMLGIAVVTQHGKEVSRPRALCRALLASAPALVFFVAWTSAYLNPFPSANAATITLLVAVAVGAVWAVVSPSRGLQDRLAGTWLVPR
jgi:uncharacterized RDD family membrane protein YckC